MTGFKLELLGVDKVLRRLDKRNTDKPIAGSIKKITMWFEATAKVSTPVDTGRLRSSVASRVEPHAGAIFTNMQYAPFIEYGTQKMEARHVEKGSSARRLGKGPFTYTLEQLQQKMKSFLGDMAHGIKARLE